MNRYVEEIVEDRLAVLSQLSESEQEDLAEELAGLKREFDQDIIGDSIESLLIEYCERDGWEDYCRHVNRALAEAGRLEPVVSNAVGSGSKLKEMQYKGVRYIAAV